MKPRDQATRARFADELAQDFSVVAPAGVGKTTAIVERILAIALHHPEWLPSLVVVTYTNRAADEMQQRARNAILSRGVDAATLAEFNRAFFGTIHSFCLRLIEHHGHHLGLPARLELVKDEQAMWLEFVRQLSHVGGDERLFRHVSMLDVIELGRYLQPERIAAVPDEAWPNTNFEPVLNCPAKGSGTKNVVRGQQLLREWLAALDGKTEFLPLPELPGGSAEFKAAWAEAFAPLRRWIGACALAVARKIAVQYRDYRLAQGLVTFDDQVALAAQLMQHAEAGPAICAEGYRVILDEAQDTDPVQFDVLRAVGDGAGRFSMVGDPQQSIYSQRADLARYRAVHERMKELTFDVTFRCDRAIVDEVNALAPAMLDNANGQVEYVKLEARPEATAGQVVRWMPGTHDVKDDWNSAQRGACEARQLAEWLKRAGLRNLRARDWSEVAVLCPLKRWFGALRRELSKAGFDVQVQSHRDVKGDSPAYAWLTALLVVAAEPRNSFEIVGVLRDVFGLSDQALADFCEGDGAKFQIETGIAGNGDVPETLTLLARARAEALALPLRDAVRRLAEATLLRERLAALPDEDGRELPGELDNLLVRTAVAEADGLSLPEWATELRRSFEEVRETETARAGAIQLITCQKAKGLEWDVVLVPFFFRAIQSHRREYPVVIERAGVPARAAFAKVDLSAEDQQALKARVRQEMQRVLYVAMTRARRTLVLVDDDELFDKQNNSFADLLCVREGAGNRGDWKKLDAKLSEESVAPAGKAARVAGLVELPAMSASDRKRALANAGKFMQRTLPHKLAKRWTTEEPEMRNDGEGESPVTTERSPAVRYGIWWHEQMKNLDWQSDPEGWTKTFTADAAPEHYRERAEKEWALFRKSELAKLLADRRRVVHAEMPVLWKRQDGSCLEGFVDLAAFDPESKEWLIVDWKTDLVKASEVNKLEDEYAGQLQAYVEALSGISGMTATGSLYSTSTGKWIKR